MRLRKRKAIIASALILSLNTSAKEFYIVKKGDTLSSILYANNVSPIYGSDGALAKSKRNINPPF